ncbi:hypothetical protein [Poseidonocella sp. HB161398]|uniref:hypothetical protein n=1 Tax=Poseidonocella sp. HB161398 TaxID=2320855 RepID=UPI001107F5D8|nr:hypothetical protein [Poseidonocella sp. HB161398]
MNATQDIQPGISAWLGRPEVLRAHGNQLQSNTGNRETARIVDGDACLRLREVLDGNGKQEVAIDCPLLAPIARILEPAWHAQAITPLADLPFSQLWLCIGNFGIDGARNAGRLVAALQDFHVLKKPIALDVAGGLAGLSVPACGGPSAISHGTGRAETRDHASWRRPPPVRKPPADGETRGGVPPLVYSAGLDAYPGSARLDGFLQPDGRMADHGNACADCCGRAELMIANRYRHFLLERGGQIDTILSCSDADRAEAFMADQRKRLWLLEQDREQPGLDDIATSILGNAAKRVSDLLKDLDEAQATRFVARAPSPLWRGVDPRNRPLIMRP